MAYYITSVKKNDKILVDKVLEQGQRLRNAMVESILKNDPFYTEVIYNNQFNTNASSLESFELTKGTTDLTSNKELVEAFIKGECMTREDEKLALESLKSLSASDLYKTTERSLRCSPLGSCKCYTCGIYNSENWKWNEGQKSKPIGENYNEVTNSIRDKYKSELISALKFVDSLKIYVNCLILNDTGQQKISSSISDQSNMNTSNQNFFLEYTLPDDLIIKKSQKLKVNSNMDKNYIRLFCRKTNDFINFKKLTIHDIERLENIDLNCCDMQFKVSFRNHRQKSTIQLGYANFNFGEFLGIKNATCSRGLVVSLNENSPISVGTLKVSLQLGCGRLYFGQEFIDAIKTSDRKSIALESDDSTNQLVEKEANNTQKLIGEAEPNSYSTNHGHVKPKERVKIDEKNVRKLPHNIRKTDQSVPVTDTNRSSYFEKTVETSNSEPISRILPVQVEEKEEQVLFGFFYVAEAQYINSPINSYLTCRPFTQQETSVSQLVANSQNPIFNFHQLIPLILEDNLLTKLRENYMIIEFWQREDTTDKVIGLTKIPLHQFYLAYRNPVILKYLMKNRLPIIGTDWWEPIYSLNNQEILGQVEVITALGTQSQINNLKLDRGFAGSFVKAQFSNPKLNHINTETNCLNTNKRGQINKTNSGKNIIFKDIRNSELKRIEKGTNTTTTPVSKLDAATQFEMNMENKREKQENNNATGSMLESFLNQLMATRPGNTHVENSTNTELVGEANNGNSNLQNAQNKTNVELRKTSDLLDSLQRAISSDNNQLSSLSTPGSTFKAMVAINNANHLPSRKKCKSRKSKSIKSEESVLPSCYVSFEASCEGDLKITPIISKSTNPVWNYKCKVNLPLDLLKNGQKRLIFKVWRKSTNTVNFPNMQTDIVLGFATVDLTVLLAGFPNVQGWFNILDFSGKCNGQINIHVTPLEDLGKYQAPKNDCDCNIKPAAETAEVSNSNEASETLSRALKRKFTELDEITQRLRLRLSKVTNESDSSSDGFVDEFEKDISSFREEDNLDDFTEEARKFSVERIAESINHEINLGANMESILMSQGGSSVGFEKEQKATSSSNCESEPEIHERGKSVKDTGHAHIPSLNQHLLQGKQQINALLEKLTLLSADPSLCLSNRYVSGCSIANEKIDEEPISFEDSLKCPPKFGELNRNSADTESPFSSTDTSLITNFTDSRPAPDGKGNTSEEQATARKD